MFDLDQLEQTAKTLCLFPEHAPTISATARFRKDALMNELVKKIRKTSDPVVQWTLLILACAVNQRRLAFVIAREKFAETVRRAGLKFNNDEYGRFVNYLAANRLTRVVFLERKSQKPMVIQITETNVVTRLADVDAQAQLTECLEFANDLSRYGDPDEINQTAPAQRDIATDTDSVASNQKPNLPKFDNQPTYLRPDKLSTERLAKFQLRQADKLSKLPSIGSKVEEQIAFASALAEIAKDCECLFNDYGDQCLNYYLPENEIKAALESALEKRFSEKSGNFSLSGEVLPKNLAI